MMRRRRTSPPPPGLSYDGRAPNSKSWGKRTAKVPMCPHIGRCPHLGERGGQCGKEAAHCNCLCLLCKSPMRARKACNALLEDGTRCTWGQDRSSDDSPPEQSPERVIAKRPRAWYRGPAPPPPPGPAPSTPRGASGQEGWLSPGVAIPNTEPGGPDAPMPSTPQRGRPLGSGRLAFDPTDYDDPFASPPRRSKLPPPVWNRTAFATAPATLSVAPPAQPAEAATE
jgi:hypothetical protein